MWPYITNQNVCMSVVVSTKKKIQEIKEINKVTNTYNKSTTKINTFNILKSTSLQKVIFFFLIDPGTNLIPHNVQRIRSIIVILTWRCATCLKLISSSRPLKSEKQKKRKAMRDSYAVSSLWSFICSIESNMNWARDLCFPQKQTCKMQN